MVKPMKRSRKRPNPARLNDHFQDTSINRDRTPDLCPLNRIGHSVTAVCADAQIQFCNVNLRTNHGRPGYFAGSAPVQAQNWALGNVNNALKMGLDLTG